MTAYVAIMLIGFCLAPHRALAGGAVNGGDAEGTIQTEVAGWAMVDDSGAVTTADPATLTTTLPDGTIAFDRGTVK